MKNKIKEILTQNGIKGVAFNSSKISPQDAFFAIKGEKADGNSYINQAFENGASVVFTDDKLQLDKHASKNIVFVDDARLALAIAAGIIYPKLPEKLIAVTGTNGKSSVVSYCFQILKHLGIPTASIGTIGIEATKDIAKRVSYGSAGELTMADPITFRRNLHELASVGARAVAFEASSHGLSQKRMGNVKVDVAGFTSFSQDHLDYHKDMAKYLAAKLQLFSHNVKEKGIAVVPSSIAEKPTILEHIKKCGLSVRIINSTDIDVDSMPMGLLGQKLDIVRYGKEYQLQTEIIGSFQSDNLLMAAELVSVATEVDYGQIIEALKVVKAVKGRLERVTNPADEYQIFVDYAHTPDSLEKSLQELGKLIKKGSNLYVVFGCGGDRDPSKRSLMGKVAALYADYVVVTDDNPRTESPDNIRAQIMYGTEDVSSNKNVFEIGDRRKAIESAIDLLKKDDILLIAGKGHEEYQVIGTTKHPFSDVMTVQNCLHNKTDT